MSQELKLTLIPANELAARITEFAKADHAHRLGVHVLAVSALAVAAKDGQISPINKLASLLALHVQRQLRSYVAEHCSAWLTTEHGEFRVKPNTKDERNAFVQEHAERLLGVNFQAERPAAEPQERAAWSPLSMAKGIERLVKRAERELDERDDLEIPDSALEALRKVVSQLKKRGERAARQAAQAERQGAHMH